MVRAFEAIEHALGHRRAGFILLVLLAAGYAVAYFQHPLFPGHDPADAARGWWTWTDQSRYLQESNAIARLELDASTYFYPVGYPALGAIFVRWMPLNPFFIPNLVFVLAAAAVWWRLAQRWLTRTMALGVGCIFIVSHPWLIAQTMVIPWNTLPTQCTLIAAIWVGLYVKGSAALGYLVGLTAVTYLFRPIDAATFAPLLVAATLKLPTWRAKLLGGTAGLLVIALVVLGVALMNLRVVGQWQTTYERVSSESIGFFGYPVSYKLYWLLVDGQPLFGELEPALLFRYPWLMLCLPAAVFLLQRERGAGLAVLATVTLNFALYLNYNDLLPSDIYRFTLIHYLSWAFPLLFLLAAAACRHFSRSGWIQMGFGLAAISALVVSGLTMEPQQRASLRETHGVYLLPNDRPLLLEFSTQPMETVSELRLTGRSLVEYSEYLVPYLPSPLTVLLGKKADGNLLTLGTDAPLTTAPIVSTYRWSWRLKPDRWKATTRYK